VSATQDSHPVSFCLRNPVSSQEEEDDTVRPVARWNAPIKWLLPFSPTGVSNGSHRFPNLIKRVITSSRAGRPQSAGQAVVPRAAHKLAFDFDGASRAWT
jgi:hypothetical protein